MYRLSIACVVLCSVRIGCRVLIVFCLCGPVLGASWLLFSVFCLCGPVLSVSIGCRGQIVFCRLSGLSGSIADWGNFSQTYAIQWSRFHNQWMRFRGPLLLINFDDLVHSLETQVKKVRELQPFPPFLSLSPSACC